MSASFREFDTGTSGATSAPRIPYRNPWLYICDADERVPPELQAELLRSVADAPDDVGAFRLRYKNMFLGKWIKRSSGYPVWVIRLVRPSRVRYEIRQTNVHPIVEGAVGRLEEHSSTKPADCPAGSLGTIRLRSLDAIAVRSRASRAAASSSADPMSAAALKNLVLPRGRASSALSETTSFGLRFLDGRSAFLRARSPCTSTDRTGSASRSALATADRQSPSNRFREQG